MNMDILNCQALIVDYRIDSETREFIESLGKRIFYTFFREDLYDEINGHPDIIAANIGDITVVDPVFYNKYKEELAEYNIVVGRKSVKPTYPDDIKYNALVTKDYLIGNIRYLDEKLVEVAKEAALTLIDVKQGYARCSTILMDSKGIITADKSIIKTCEPFMKVCTIDGNSTIKLGNMEGFIGGASFVWGDKLVIFGEGKLHKSYNEIVRFTNSFGVSVISSKKGEIMDYGSVIPLFKYRGSKS